MDLDIIDGYDESGFWGNMRTRPESGEHRLLLAIIEDAVSSYRNYRHATNWRMRRLWEAARDWLFDDKPQQWGFSFDYCCQQLELDAGYIRRKLRQTGARGRRRHPRVSGSRHQIRAA